MAYRPAGDHLLAALLESSEDAIVGVSFDGTIEIWSPGAARLYGYSAEEMTGRPLQRLLPVYESPQLDLFLSSNGANPSPSLELGERVHKNGSRLLVSVRRSAIRNGSGEPLGVLELARALEPHEALWLPQEVPIRLLLDQAPGFLWTTDRNLRIATYWGAGLPTAKIRRGSLVGQSIGEFLGSANPNATPIAEHHHPLAAAFRALNTRGRAAFSRSALAPCAHPPAKSLAALAQPSTSPNASAPKSRCCFRRATTPSPASPTTANSWTASNAKCAAQNAAITPLRCCCSI